MGREATLRQAGILKTKFSRWIICSKQDFSYEMDTIEDGKKVNKKIIDIKYTPYQTLNEIVTNKAVRNVVVPFKTKDDAIDYLKEVVNTLPIEQQNQLFTSDTVLLEVRNLPTERKMYNQDWIKQQVLNEVTVDLKSLKSSKLL